MSNHTYRRTLSDASSSSSFFSIASNSSRMVLPYQLYEKKEVARPMIALVSSPHSVATSTIDSTSDSPVERVSAHTLVSPPS